MSLPSSYRVQDGCWNCRHCVDRSHPDGEEWYCAIDGTKPPKHPARGYKDVEAMRKYYEDLTAWEAVRSVLRNGICDKHERRRG